MKTSVLFLPLSATSVGNLGNINKLRTGDADLRF